MNAWCNNLKVEGGITVCIRSHKERSYRVFSVTIILLERWWLWRWKGRIREWLSDLRGSSWDERHTLLVELNTIFSVMNGQTRLRWMDVQVQLWEYMSMSVTTVYCFFYPTLYFSPLLCLLRNSITYPLFSLSIHISPFLLHPFNSYHLPLFSFIVSCLSPRPPLNPLVKASPGVVDNDLRWYRVIRCSTWYRWGQVRSGQGRSGQGMSHSHLTWPDLTDWKLGKETKCK